MPNLSIAATFSSAVALGGQFGVIHEPLRSIPYFA